MEIESNYEAILEKLIDQTKIYGASLNTTDGLPIISVFKNHKTIEDAFISALSSAMTMQSEKVISEFGCGSLDNCKIQGDDGQVLLWKVGESKILLVLAPKSISQGILHLGIKNSIRSLEKVNM
jgi:predicted regulator of Ras-like GTPase activity (Roadblock/LC7/MglB family)